MSPTFTLDDIPPDEIYVLDTETTGLDGAPMDLVLDIGICKVSLREGTVEDWYSSVLGYDVEWWDDRLLNSWIFQNSDLTVDEIAFARKSAMQVIDEVRRLLKGKNVTTYNTVYDLGKFLYQEPWSMRGWFNECTDIMKAATPVCKVPSTRLQRLPVPQAGGGLREDNRGRPRRTPRETGPQSPLRRAGGLLGDDTDVQGRNIPPVKSRSF